MTQFPSTPLTPPEPRPYEAAGDAKNGRGITRLHFAPGRSFGSSGPRQQRNRVLLAVYELTEGNPLKSVVSADIAAQTGLAEEAAEAAVRWLVDRESLSVESLAGDVTVTPGGSDEAERLLTEGVDPAAGAAVAGVLGNAAYAGLHALMT